MNIFSYSTNTRDDGDTWTHTWILEDVTDPDDAVELITRKHASSRGSDAPGAIFHDAPYLAAFDPDRKRAVVYQFGGFDT